MTENEFETAIDKLDMHPSMQDALYEIRVNGENRYKVMRKYRIRQVHLNRALQKLNEAYEQLYA